jgi:hypothetical protein
MQQEESLFQKLARARVAQARAMQRFSRAQARITLAEERFRAAQARLQAQEPALPANAEEVGPATEMDAEVGDLEAETSAPPDREKTDTTARIPVIRQSQPSQELA